MSVLEQMNSAQDKPQVGAVADAKVSFFSPPINFYFLKEECGANWLHSSKEAENLENQGLVLSAAAAVVVVVMNCPTKL